MSAQWDGMRIFWDAAGDSDTVCDACYAKIPVDDLRPDPDNVFAELDFPQVYVTEYIEVDSPLHCDWCARPIKHRLTSDGVDYVVDMLRAFIDAPQFDNMETKSPMPHWYADSPLYAVLLDWADDLQWCGPSEQQQEVVEKFLEVVYRIENNAKFRLLIVAQRVKFRVQYAIFLKKRKVSAFMKKRHLKTMQEIEEF